MIKFYAPFLILYFVLNQIYAQTASYEISSETKLSVIDDYLQKKIDEGVIPGGVFLIAEKGEITYFKSLGYNDKSDNDSYQKDDIFRIASMTKNVTIVGILQLMESGKLQLDDPVSKYIPAFKKTRVLERFNPLDSSITTVPQKKEITLRNLLTHTSGIYYGSFETDSLRAVYAKSDLMSFGLSNTEFTTEEMANKIAAAPLAFQPGSQFKYGLNMEVLGRVIEVVADTSLDKYFYQNIFKPLGMKDTYFYVPEDKQNRIVKVHASDTVAHIIEHPFVDYPKMPITDHFAGGGGLSSTTLDYGILCMALANEGSINNTRILNKKSVRLMSEVQFSELDNNNKGFMSSIDEMGFGLGYWVIKKENPDFSPLSEKSFGWSGIFNTKFSIDPKKDLIIVGMTQMFSFDNEGFWNELNRVIYKALK